MDENPNIAALMRLNARLHKRVDVLFQALEQIHGPTPCSGAMTHDEAGKPLTPEAAESMRRAHARSCHRCVARVAMNDCSDIPIDAFVTLPVGSDPRDLMQRVLQAEASEAQLARMAGEYERRFMAIIGPELLKRREQQDAKHGGPTHDDTHTQVEWCHFINGYTWKAYHDVPMQNEEEMPPEYFQDKMLDVAALAVSAIQSSRRKHPVCTDCKAIVGTQHKPHCHRQGLVTKDSVYIHNLVGGSANDTARTTGD